MAGFTREFTIFGWNCGMQIPGALLFIQILSLELFGVGCVGLADPSKRADAVYGAIGNTLVQPAASMATIQAGIGSGNERRGLPNTIGWYQIPNTVLTSVCPPVSQFPAIQGVEGCKAVVNDWSGGAADTRRNRLVVWGGGHHGYYGNEVYALDLNNPQMIRLNDPSSVTGIDFNTFCGETYADGTPSSRHTYGGITYVPSIDSLFSDGGSKAGCGFLGNSRYTFSLSTQTWKTQSSGSTNAVPGKMAQYDPNTGLVFIADPASTPTAKLWTWNPSNGVLTQLKDYNISWDIHESSVLDTQRHILFVIGNGIFTKTDISVGSQYTLVNLAGSATGCSALVSQAYPGLAFDTVQGLVVGWVGGDSVIEYNPGTNSCTTVTYSGGPGTAVANGTYGRFQYFSALNLFALVNNPNQNAYALRLTLLK